jgi:hypothetical protein
MIRESKMNDEKIWYYQYLDLPKIPEKFIDEAKTILKDEKIKRKQALQSLSSSWTQKFDPEKKEISYGMFRKMNDHGKTITSRSVVRFSVNVEFESWIRKNIVNDFIDASIAPSYNQNEEDQVLGPHTDTTRDYLLVYLFDTSNTDQKTVWWQENGHPVVREYNISTNDFESMTKLEELEIEKERWILLNARILHSVHNINGYRDAIQISLKDKLF